MRSPVKPLVVWGLVCKFHLQGNLSKCNRQLNLHIPQGLRFKSHSQGNLFPNATYNSTPHTMRVLICTLQLQGNLSPNAIDSSTPRTLRGFICKFHLRGNLSPNAIVNSTHQALQELYHDVEREVNNMPPLSESKQFILAQWDVFH